MTGIGKFKAGLTIVLLLLTASSTYAEGKKYKASIAQMPFISESPTKGVLVFLVKAWADATKNDIEIQTYPFARSLDNVITNKADFQFPFIKNPTVDETKLDFDFSTSPIYRVNFVLYTNKKKPVDITNPGKYKITTDAAHVDYMGFKVEPEFDVAGALKKLDAGLIDGFIHAEVVADPVLRELKLVNIKRELFKIYDVHAVLPKGQKGKDTDKMITEGLALVKKSGKYSELMDPVYKKYDNWQP